VIEQLLRAENALSLGLLDQAEQIYAQTLAHDPVNAIALVGLSRVALERGDERASLVLARRARAIDPENAQAGRMVARLEEVIRERGDDLPAVEAASPSSQPAAATATTTPPSPTSAAPDVAPKRRGILRRLTGRS
jgi:tetratricopeptide (TPR) repeat protein